MCGAAAVFTAIIFAMGVGYLLVRWVDWYFFSPSSSEHYVPDAIPTLVAETGFPGLDTALEHYYADPTAANEAEVVFQTAKTEGAIAECC